MSLCRFFLLLTCYWSSFTYLQAQSCEDDFELTRIKIAYDHGQYTKAERWVEAFLKKQPTCAEAHYWRARCLEAFEEYSAAYEAYTLACEFNKAHPQYWLARGDFKRMLGMVRLQSPTTCGDCGKQWLPNIGSASPATTYFQSALEDYQMALEQQPRSPMAHYAAAVTYQALGKSELACQHAHHAHKLEYRQAQTYIQEHCSPQE